MGSKSKDKDTGSQAFLYVVVAFATVGAILFGLDQGNWAGAIEKPDFVRAFCGDSVECMDPEEHPRWYTGFLSWGSSLVQLGAFFGALFLAPPIAGRSGRREGMFVGCLITIAGVVPMCLVSSKTIFMLVRFIAGIGVGIVTYALPMFIAEVSPPSIRGTLGSAFQLLMVLGMIAASLLNTQKWFNYKASFSLPLYPAIIMVLGIFCFPVSPRFALIKAKRKGTMEKGTKLALDALTKLRGSKKLAEEELAELKAGMEEEEEEAPWSTLFNDPSIFKRVMIANGLQWMQQFTGINALLSYGPSMLKAAKLEMDPEVAQFIINCFNLLGTITMMCVIDRFGRRPLLLVGSASMLVFMVGAAVIAIQMEIYDNHKGMGTGLMVCLCGYITSFGIGWGGVCWVYPSEIFPMDVKEKAMSTSVGSQWLANFLIAFLVPYQVAEMNLYGTFIFYSVCLVIIFAIVFFFVPETKGLPLEEMDNLFGARLGIPASDESNSEGETSGEEGGGSDWRAVRRAQQEEGVC